MACHECPASPTFKDWLVRTEATDTVHVERSLNRSYRVRRNAAAEKVLELEEDGITMAQLLSYIGGESLCKVLFEGDLDAGVVACGPSAGLIRDVASVDDIVKGIIRQARSIVETIYAS